MTLFYNEMTLVPFLAHLLSDEQIAIISNLNTRWDLYDEAKHTLYIPLLPKS